MQLEQLYQDIILDHYKKPRGRGLREPFDEQVHHVNPTCGDEVDLRVHVVDGERRRHVVRRHGLLDQPGLGQRAVRAGGRQDRRDALSRVDAFTELVSSRGQVEPDEAVLEDAVAFAGVAKYPARVKCALLAWMAFKDATARALAKEEMTQ